MTIEPNVNNVLRLKLSIIMVAKIVTTKLTTPIPTEIQMALASLKPNPLMNTCGKK